MIGSLASAGRIVPVMKEAAATHDVGLAVLKKSQDIEKTNGESALKLIASATAVTNSGGIDIHV